MGRNKQHKVLKDWTTEEEHLMMNLMEKRILEGYGPYRACELVGNEMGRSKASVRNRYYDIKLRQTAYEDVELPPVKSHAEAPIGEPTQEQMWFTTEEPETKEEEIFTPEANAIIVDDKGGEVEMPANKVDPESVIDFIKESFGKLKKLEEDNQYIQLLEEDNEKMKTEIDSLKAEIAQLKQQVALTANAAAELAEIKPTYELLLKIMNDTRAKLTSEEIGVPSGGIKFKADRNGNLERVG